MSMLSSPVAMGDTTPLQRKAKPPSKPRQTTQRRVYGKRRADAARAVFDQRSPAKEVEKAKKIIVQDAIENIQVKLAEVQLDETPVPEETMSEKETAPEQCLETDATPSSNDETPVPTVEVQDEPVPVESSPPKTSPIAAPKRYERMVEVRISTRTSLEKTLEPETQDQPTTTSDKEPIEKTPAPEEGPQSTTASEALSATASEKRSTRRKNPSPRVSSGYVMDAKANTYVQPILDEALSPVAAGSVQKFSSWAARGGNMLQVVKIAEGSYGEVYKLRLREEVCEKEMSKSKLARLRAYGDGVFKIVPLRAKSGPGSKKHTTINEIVSEVRMLKYLDPIPGFARFREIHVVQGRFPESFQNAWDYYKETKDDCLNPNPSNKRAYPDTQLWAIVEMDDAGCELEKFAWSSIFQIYDIFWGVAMALARSEEYAQFEHRDLHLGNVCIRSTRPDGCMDPPTTTDIMSRSSASGFGLSTLETTIIDYSLSRAELRSVESGEIVDVASSDLDKKQIFDAVGRDEDEILLRDTYRHMRATLYTGNPSEAEKPADVPGIWADYAPRTNLVWLLFLLKSLLKNKKPEPNSLKPARQALAPCTPNKTIKQAGKSGKKDSKSRPGVLAVGSQDKVVSKLEDMLGKRLDAVLELLDLQNGHEDMCCAADLVAYAMDSQWLDERDFF
ncbi:hypothetical protein P168DRAFT_249192 [Aspergillus campestris IBT 28561]|uniref:non-specific serine/threonine protein kinase n=1 Tax=Aspergillus campestris (strain IBT 28561) TaxID=1392248 RepID=A0A2I1D999_ASPC2|nr:uncharacterized protein P168DRAFT_249192 [Aspergillus campestris IBT 28561]PKY06439.1 hypothetical protein P168DRAFT_249192 [Aspergillus campestris IBT 28561]